MPPFDVSSSSVVTDIAYDATSGKLYGVGRTASGNFFRAWDSSGVLTDVSFNLTSIGVGSGTTVEDNGGNISAHNGVVAIKQGDNSLDVARFDVSGNALTPFDVASSSVVADIAFDAASGRLFAVGRTAAGNFFRSWDTSGAFTDVSFNFTSIGLASGVTIDNGGGIAVHNGVVAVKQGDNVLDIARFDLSGNALAPFDVPASSVLADIAFDANSGNLYGVGRTAAGNFVRAWDASGIFTDFSFNFSSIGLGSGVMVEDAGDLTVLTAAVPEANSWRMMGVVSIITAGMVIVRRGNLLHCNDSIQLV